MSKARSPAPAMTRRRLRALARRLLGDVGDGLERHLEQLTVALCPDPAPPERRGAATFQRLLVTGPKGEA